MKILITGADGQLGKSIQDVAKEHPKLEFVYTDYRELDITDPKKIDSFFEGNKFDFCVNCAAYTMVDKAESEADWAFQLNAEAVGHLATACKKYDVSLIHISTDFVFDGAKKSPYTEEDIPNPMNVYGLSKLKGEQYIQNRMVKYFIIRTSWLYSEYGNNFVKSMLRLAKDRDAINVVNDQMGSPTNATDLAKVIVQLMEENSNKYGLYHYRNMGETSWYDFARAIYDEKKVTVTVRPIPSIEYPTPAKRPKYSVMDTSKIKEALQIEIPFWGESLKKTCKNCA
ncbi:MAG: dTDP-4-dehydrorhamnose reductase [Maribacter sp.]|nr:dTDP-4-dehydrorhamnose reductase [Maribacter sp.]